MASFNSQRPVQPTHPLHSNRPNGLDAKASGATPGCHQTRGYDEAGHQLEKLEFALAVAITRGDQLRVEQLRSAIAALGGNREEPGT